jgi:uncharacterized phage protein gp47/JayE
MPYQRPTLSALVQQVASDITSNVIGADGLLRRSVLTVIGKVQAGLANLHYGYLDWIAKQSNPWTADGEFAQGWGGFKGVTLKGANSATGTVTFSGVNDTVLAAGSLVVRSDQRKFITSADATVSGGVVVAPAMDQSNGAAGNTDAGTPFTLGVSLDGIQSIGSAASDFTGGADVENPDAYKARYLQVYSNPPQGGDATDYEEWAGEVAGVTRSWTLRNGQGAGTVVVYFMMDLAEAAHNGFPQGSNGVAAAELRDIPATGDQLIVANYIYSLQPVTALVYACSPAATPQNFTIKGLLPFTTANQNAVAAAIADVFLRYGDPTGTMSIPFEDVENAISAIGGITDFIIISPTSDISTSVGYLPTVGTITWTS